MSLLSACLLWLLLLALLANLLRHLPLLPGLAVAAGLAVLALALWQAPLAGASEWLGREVDLERRTTFFSFTLALDVVARGPGLLLVIGGACLAFAAAWVNADRVLFPTIPIVLAVLLVTLSSGPLLWAPLWLVAAAAMMAFPAQGASPRLARGALRILLTPTLAFPFFLFTAWVFNQPTVAADDPVLWTDAWRALVIGVILLLAPVPLHGWITALGEDAPPFAAAFIVGAWQLTAYALVRRIFLAYPPLADYADPGQWLPWLAVSQLAWAGLFALGSNRLGQFWGYLLLWDYGATFLVWSMSGEFGTQAMTTLFLVRPFVHAIVAAGIQTLYSRYGENPAYLNLQGASERLPVATLAVVAGALFVLGWPLGALFPSRLSLLSLAEITHARVFLAIIPTFVLMTLGVIRVLRALTQPLADDQLAREPSRLVWLVLPLLLAGLLFALNPPLLEPITLQLVNWMTSL